MLFTACPVKECAENNKGWCLSAMDYTDCCVHEIYDDEEENEWKIQDKQFQDGILIFKDGKVIFNE